MSEAVALWVQSAARVIRVRADALTWVRRIGYLVLGLQLVGFLAWSTILYHRFAETRDFAVYHQAWYLIAHGNMYPFDTAWGHPFARGDSEYGMWLIAPLYWIWPHDVVLLWVQDICIVWAEAVAFTWMCEIAERRNGDQYASWLAITGLMLFIVNPWIWWSVSFDFHVEALAMPFIVMLTRDLVKGKRRCWIWAILTIAIGAQTAIYVAAAGLSGILAGQRSRSTGALMAGLGIGYSVLIALLHVNQGATIVGKYGYLAALPPGVTPSLLDMGKGIVLHPLRAPEALWAKHVNLLANLMPAGLVGVADILILPLIIVAVLENFLVPGTSFSAPIFQNLAIYVLLPVGTVGMLCWLARRHRRTAMLLAGVIVAQCLGWAIVWGPRTSQQWLRVTGSDAATLAVIKSRIPDSAEVIGSQGIVGDFSDRAVVYALFGRGGIPVSRNDVWFVIAPEVGIERRSTAEEMGLIGELSGPLHATLVAHSNGVWAFRWRPPQGVHEITPPGETTPLPAWAAQATPGEVGRPVMTGPVRTWRMTSSGGRGYVADGMAWQESPGRYQVLVSLSAAGPVNVEVWNDTGNMLLVRQSVPATTGPESVALQVDATTPRRARTYSGWGPFRAYFKPPPPGERLEVRVWTPGGHRVNVYSAQLTPVSNGNVGQARTLSGKS